VKENAVYNHETSNSDAELATPEIHRRLTDLMKAAIPPTAKKPKNAIKSVGGERESDLPEASSWGLADTQTSVQSCIEVLQLPSDSND